MDFSEDYIKTFHKVPKFGKPFFTDFQPKPSTSKGFDHSSRKDDYALESDDKSYDEKEEHKDMLGSETNSETEDDGKLLDKITKIFFQA